MGIVAHAAAKATIRRGAMGGKRKRIVPGDFVLHSLRHTRLARLGESEVDDVTIVRIAGLGGITVLPRRLHPAPEAVERAFERRRLAVANAENQPKRLSPATVSATIVQTVAASH